MDAQLEKLTKFLKKDQISTDPQDLENYGRDWTKVFPSKALAILFPRTTQEVQSIVKWAIDHKDTISLVPSGGRTGLSGGAVASKGEVVLSLQRMNKIGEFNEVDRLIHCESGVITQELQEAVKKKGYFFPVDFASRGSSQVGGNISTNAGGTKVIRYGLMRDWVAGLEVVTGAGEILKMDQALVKNNAGYDLKQLFIGSEGSLGIITSAILKFTSPPEIPTVLLLQSAKLEFSTEILKRFRNRISLTAFEFFTQRAIERVLENQKNEAAPFQKISPFYFLIEFEQKSDSVLDEALAVFDDLKADGLVIDGTLSQNDQQKDKLWSYRENISEALSKFKPYKNDISVKISDIPEFVREAEDVLVKNFPKTEIIWFGHIGDGNLHINVIRQDGQADSAFEKDCQNISQKLFEVLKKFNGSISAEHGIGLLKKPYLSLSRMPEEIQAMKQLKKVFDPHGILNPGKIFDT